MIWVLCIIAAICTVSVIRAFVAFLNWRWAVPFLLLMAWASHPLSWALNKLPNPNAPYKGSVEVVSAEISGIPTNNIGPWPMAPEDAHALWFSLDIRVRMDHPFYANYAICAFRGPVSVAGTVIGTRQILVSMVAGAKTSISYFPGEFYPGIDTLGPVEHDQSVFYLSTTQTDLMTRHDKMVWCHVGPDMQQLAASLHLTVDDHGVIQGNRITWIGHHAEFPVGDLQQHLASPDVLEAMSEVVVR